MGKKEIETFLTHFAVDKNVSSTTQNQAFNAILFLHKEVLGVDTSEWNIQALRAKIKEHMLIVSTKKEVKQVIFYRIVLAIILSKFIL